MPLTEADGSIGDQDADCADILVVDDLAEKLLVFKTVLAELRQNLVMARSGAEALRQVLQRDFAVIMLDVNMPEMDGFETAALIRRYKRSAHTPIIFITSFADEMQTARGYSLGAVDYIPSPVVPEVLRSKVRVFVELHILQKRIARQADERVALAASEAALKLAEETTRRSTMLSELSHALSGLIDIGTGMHTLLEHVVPALASAATLAILDEQHQVQRVMRRTRLADGAAESVEMAPAALPTASLVALQRALEHGVEWRQGSPPMLANASGQMLPLVHGERVLGALWIDGEMTDLASALLDEVGSRAAIAFASARLYGNLQIEINERRQAEAWLEESARRKDEFLAMLAHELRNPLAPIRNAVELIRLIAPPNAKLSWAADVTDRQVRQLTRLVDELLDVARIRQGKIVLQTDKMDLAALIAQCVEAQRPFLAARRLSLSIALPSTPIWVLGDGTRLTQVINNLVANAMKYTPEGGSITLSLERDGTQAVFSVRDDGIGIEPDLLPYVFELFIQGKRAPDRNQGGLGVGLTLVDRIVKLHGGHVQAISDGPGRGAEFRVVLPCLHDVDGPRVSGELGASPIAAVVSRRVLVVDDNADIAETTALLLEMSGHVVRAVADGMQALACAAEFLPEIVLLDIGLPAMDGYEVARRLREMPETRDARLIALTGYGQRADRLRGQVAGFDGHLLKPVDPAALGRLIAA